MRRRPSAATLAWVERAVGRGARVVAWRRLTGGITSSVHRLAVDTRAGRRHLVLRRWLPQTDEDRSWTAGAVDREAAALEAVAGSGVPAPRLVAARPARAIREPGEPEALLMTRVPGHVHLQPRDLDRWLRQMAAVLPRIHAIGVPVKPRLAAGGAPDRVPSWSTRPDLWRAALDLQRGRPSSRAACFIHHDFQHFNLLWARERLTGIVDWIEASSGPPDIDVGHCRLNLAVLFSPEVAERFRLAYEAEAGRAVDPWWDVHALMAYDELWKRFIPWQVDGRAPVDVDGMTARVERLLELALARV